jgi:hypothetical protein
VEVDAAVVCGGGCAKSHQRCLGAKERASRNQLPPAYRTPGNLDEYPGAAADRGRS